MVDPAPAEPLAAIRLHLSRVLGDLNTEAIDALAGEAREGYLAGGEELFHEGDAGAAAYLILSGRLRAVRADGSGGERLLQEMGPGEFVGEMPLVRPGPRAATVRAVRDTHLATLTPEGFARVTDRHPEVLRRVAALLVDRLRAQAEGAALRRAPVRSVVVAPADPGAPVAAVARGLERALADRGRVRRIDARAFAQARPELSAALLSNAPEPRIVGWLGEQEADGAIALYECDPEASPWTDRCLRQADHVVWVAAPDRREGSLLRRMLDQKPCGAERSLVSLGAGASSAARVGFRFTLRLRAESDFARLARLVTGTALGLVLGGGGARGFAHLGVLRALEELGIPVDAIAGTSAGAVVGALAARGFDAATVRELCRRTSRSLVDPTLPMTALLRGRRVAARLAQAIGDASIEELAIPFLSVSTSLSRGAVRVHRSGPLLRAVRASLSVPGILPPVVEEGELLVDGALLDNLPILAMRELTGDGPVLAVDVGGGFTSVTYPDLPPDLSGWSVLGRRLRGPSTPPGAPTIFEILMRSAMVSSIGAPARAALREGTDLYLAPPVQDYGLFAFDRLDEIAERGHRAALESVRAWRQRPRAASGHA